MSRWRKFLDYTQPISAEQGEPDATCGNLRELPLPPGGKTPPRNPQPRLLPARDNQLTSFRWPRNMLLLGGEGVMDGEWYFLPQQVSGSGLEVLTLKRG